MHARPDDVRHLHTLGPHGTNLEAASHEWLRRRGVTDGSVTLHASIEEALEAVPDDGRHALTACAVYPALHTLVFANLHRLHMIDSFVMPTHNMVLASRGTDTPAVVASHPAPQGLVRPALAPAGVEVLEVLSNSQAAIDCAEGRVDGCITTIVAAERHGLRVIRDFGPVPMVFTVHQVLAVDLSSDAAAIASDTAAPLAGAAR
ncbi:bacilysin biosynthesis protein BacA [Streptomyces sp. SKN60]|uniref:prephenate dehydratase domain-containing protein n=1 Tax=Streptomyces sp. SKN60 TaxID=2855506 RepID=UPI0022476B31|nr:prephenate dehydratase domain-containing protein [Streptomyces sp. SKN60]MCX2180712.1 bacilysin biosynthesis protein BacA [Streptomyces sp. SKN60]